MSIVSKPNIFQAGNVADAAAVNANFDAIFNDYNGNIDDSNVALTGITTYGKVSGSALSVLGNINSGAGTVPVANLPTGTTANKLVKLDASAKLPAVDGSQLTNLTFTQVGFGSWVDKSSSYAAQQATTDGFIIATITYSSGTDVSQDFIGYTDSSASPTTIRAKANAGRVSNYAGRSNCGSFCMPVKKNDYWKCVASNVDGSGSFTYTVFWLPLGS